MGSRIRQFSVVIHDVPPGSKTLVQAALHKLCKKYVIALEQYNHQEGYHLHLFYLCKNASSILREVNRWKAFKWGRVQVDPMRGTFDQASVYVIAADKIKYQDPNPIIYPPISDQDGRFCDCGYTTHMRYSIAAYQKLMNGQRELAHESFQEALQARLDDWYTACICRTHKKFSRHANDIFPQEIKSMRPVNGGTSVQEEDDDQEICEEVDGSEDRDDWYGGSDEETAGSGFEADESGSQSD